ncbi:MAG: nucleoside kinase [Clostridia bacterium]|nr:nucleoside kinase [Clostridia bacterium]
MKVDLIREPRAKAETIEVAGGTSIEELYKKYGKGLKYTVLAARIDYNNVDLLTKIDKPCTISFLDMRDLAANLIYQHSLSLIYLKAVYDVLGEVTVEIQNSLNKGLYTHIKLAAPVKISQVKQIEARMWEIVEDDIPIVKEIMPLKDGVEMLKKMGNPTKAEILKSSGKTKAKFYSIDDYRNYFYGLMVPSTGYIDKFELRKYKKGVLLRFPHPSNPAEIPPYIDETRLYSAFSEATKWGRLMGVNFVTDLNQKVRDGSYKELIQLSEALHEKKIAEIADMITKRRKRIILIAGPSSSGKTTFARRLCIQLRVNGLNPLYMGTDDYFVERKDTPRDENGEMDFENLDAMDIELFNRNMNDLLAGREVDMPTFDFMTGTKVFGKRVTRLEEGRPIVIEGIHALNNEMTKFLPADEKFKIYISPLTQLNIDAHNRIPTTDARMLRRMVRDFRYRGHSAQATIQNWPKVRRGEDKNIFPYSGEADVLFNSVHIYELSVLKKYAQPLLESIKPDEPEYSEAVRMLKFLRFFDIIEDDSIIANNSIIREFIGGSIFVS